MTRTSFLIGENLARCSERMSVWHMSVCNEETFGCLLISFV